MESNKKIFAYIYLIREREFLQNNENVYKYGKTCCSDATLFVPRLKHYKKGSELVFIMQVPIHKVDIIESQITQRFKKLFERHNDGYEYFIGDPNTMIKEMIDIIFFNFNNTVNEVKTITSYEDYLLHSSIEKIVLIEKESSGYIISNGIISDFISAENIEVLLKSYILHEDYQYDLQSIISDINKTCFDPCFKPKKQIIYRTLERLYGFKLMKRDLFTKTTRELYELILTKRNDLNIR